MSSESFFCALSFEAIARFIRRAQRFVCYAGPGIQLEVAQALLDVVAKLGPEMLTVCLGFDERVMRMGYGSIEAVGLLRDAGIVVRSAPGMRTGLAIADDCGFVYTPTPLYLEGAKPRACGRAALPALQLRAHSQDAARDTSHAGRHRRSRMVAGRHRSAGRVMIGRTSARMVVYVS